MFGIKTLSRVAILLGLGIYSLVFAEFFLRIFKPQALLPRYVTGSEIGIRQNIPNAHYWHYTPEVEVEMQINSVGMRDTREYELTKPEGVCRIVILGDSFFMSYEVNLEDSFAYRLQHHLQKSGLNCEVINFAVSGFGTAESLIQLRERGLAYNPDFVVLQWHDTDPEDNIRAGLFRKEGERLIKGLDSYLPAVSVREKLMKIPGYEWAIQNSHLYTAARANLASFAKSMLVKLKSQKPTPPKPAQADTPAPIKEESQSTLSSLLVNEVAKITQDNGAELILAEIPSLRGGGSIENGFKQLKGQIDPNIFRASATDELEKLQQAGEKIFFMQGHFHFTPIGYDTFAKAVAQSIQVAAKKP